jgi:O-antigen/teichoic acid export membrane protein
MVMGVARSLEQWNGRYRHFKLISLSSVVGTIVANAWMVIGGLWDAGALALILGTVINQFIRLVILIKGTREKLFSSLLWPVDFGEVKRMACFYADFPKYRAPQDTLNALSQHLPSLILAIFFSPLQVGFFWLAHRVLRLPGLLISESIRKVFYQKVSEYANAERQFFPLAVKVTCGLAVVGVLPLWITIVWAPDLFSRIFGANWVVAGEYAQWLCICTYFSFINVPAVVVAPVLGKQKFMLFFEIVSVCVKSSAILFMAFFTKNSLYAISVFSVSTSFLSIILIVSVLKACREYDFNLEN